MRRPNRWLNASDGVVEFRSRCMWSSECEMSVISIPDFPIVFFSDETTGNDRSPNKSTPHEPGDNT